MNSSLDYSTILSALDQASAFDLFRLKKAINMALEDPDRIRPVMAAITPGMQTHYFDWTENRDVACTIISKRRKEVSVRNHEDNRVYDMPCYMLNLDNADTTIRQRKTHSGMSRQELSIGMNVGFNDRDDRPVYGVVERLNPKSVSIRTPEGKWRVAYSFLYPVIDTSATDKSDHHQPLLNEQRVIEGEVIIDPAEER